MIDQTKNVDANALGQSEQTIPVKADDSGATRGYLNAKKSIQPYLTYYDTQPYSKTTDLLGDRLEILLPVGNVTHYWVATRNVTPETLLTDDSVYRAHFDVFCVELGCFRGSIMFMGTFEYGKRDGLFPVVTLNSELLEGGENGKWNVDLN